MTTVGKRSDAKLCCPDRGSAALLLAHGFRQGQRSVIGDDSASANKARNTFHSLPTAVALGFFFGRGLAGLGLGRRRRRRLGDQRGVRQQSIGLQACEPTSQPALHEPPRALSNVGSSAILSSTSCSLGLCFLHQPPSVSTGLVGVPRLIPASVPEFGPRPPATLDVAVARPPCSTA